MKSLFPISYNEAELDSQINDWVNIGKSYATQKKSKDLSSFEKKDTEIPEVQKTIPNPSGYFNIENRVKAKDLLELSESSEEEEQIKKEKKKAKKEKKKDKKAKKEKRKKEQNYDLIKYDEGDLVEMLDEDYIEKPKLDHDTNFLYKYKIGDNLCDITIMRFGEKENYTYGLQTKVISLFRRIKYNIIMGLKSDNNTLDIIDELNQILGIKGSIIKEAYDDKLEMNKRYYNSSSKGEVDLSPNKIKKHKIQKEILKQDFIPLEIEEKSIVIKDHEGLEQNFDLNDMSNNETKILEITKYYNKNLDLNPDNLLLWIDFLKFQDKHHLLMNIKSISSLIEKKLSIIEKAMKQPNIKNDPLMILIHMKTLDSSNKNDDFFKILNTTWLNYLEQNFENFLFWRVYLDFRFSNYANFQMSIIRETLETLFKKIHEKILLSNNQNQIANLQQLQIFIIQRLCFIEKYSGFTERSTGILQGLIEYNIFAPENLDDMHSKLKIFQEYFEDYDAPKIGEIVNYSGWSDYSKRKIKISDDNKDAFIGNFELKILKVYNNNNELSENDANILNDQEFFKEKVDDIEILKNISMELEKKKEIYDKILDEILKIKEKEVIQWKNKEIKSMEYWRSANNSFSFDKPRINENPYCVVLYEDLANYMLQINKEYFKIQLINIFFENLDFPRLFSEVFISSEDYLINYLLFKNLEQLFEKMKFSEANDTNTDNDNNYITEDILKYLKINDLFLKFPLIKQICKKNIFCPSFFSKIEYIRRLLYQLKAKFVQSDSILCYIFYIEWLYTKLEDFKHIQEIKDSYKRIKILLKENEKNIFLWIIFAEQNYEKDGKLENLIKVYENVLQFCTKKKQMMIIYYFYLNFYLNHDLNNNQKQYKQKMLQLLWRFCSLLIGKNKFDASFNNSGEAISSIQLMQIYKIIHEELEKTMANSTTKQRKHNNKIKSSLFEHHKIFPLNKLSLLIYFEQITLLLSHRAINIQIATLNQNLIRLEEKMREITDNYTEADEIRYINHNIENSIQILQFLLCKIYIYEKSSSTYIDSEFSLNTISGIIAKFPKNYLLNLIFIEMIMSSSYRINQLANIKKYLGYKQFSPTIFMLILLKVVSKYVCLDKKSCQNIVRAYISEFLAEYNPYDGIISEIEKKYRKDITINWEDIDFLKDNSLLNHYFIMKLHVKFTLLFGTSKQFKDATLISLHRFPYIKEAYISHIQSLLNSSLIQKKDPEMLKNIQEMLKIMDDKEIRIYTDLEMIDDIPNL